ncbi:AraC family transcriptional regulator [Arcobacter sp. CECT 8983]|uniref:helix-turn-helix domain-containing protein n=1 Tax=Arcobacter sp. CECT 8983 TaxID=2044508 RepID=UPI00100A5C86|nr:AraC family transcriptional regulator [Arcobacter sp. CECT 8983]RXJ91212.1 AraC family transcriptional regulator [Arcobacter sp. CECT 8983]
MKKINLKDLIELDEEINHPFSRKISVSNIKKKFGRGIIIKYDIGNGIAIFARNFTLNEDIILTEESDIPGACFIFNLENNLTFNYKDKKEYILKKNHFFIELASNKFYCEIPIKKDEPFLTIFLAVKDTLFLKLASSIENIHDYMNKAFCQSYYILEGLEIDTLQLELFNEFKDKTYFEDILKNIYLESKTTKLLHYSIEKVSKNLNAPLVNFNKNRILSLERAKEMIMQKYDEKLSIKEIAYKSAINECYLKKDFKEYFGMTIHEMLQKRRLEISKQLLQEDFCVKEVAFKVGYKHTSNFSKIFKKQFNISPAKYKKQFI